MRHETFGYNMSVRFTPAAAALLDSLGNGFGDAIATHLDLAFTTHETLLARLMPFASSTYLTIAYDFEAGRPIDRIASRQWLDCRIPETAWFFAEREGAGWRVCLDAEAVDAAAADLLNASEEKLREIYPDFPAIADLD